MDLALLLYVSFLLVTWVMRHFLLRWTLTHDLHLRLATKLTARSKR